MGHLLGKSCPLGFSLVLFFIFNAVLTVGVAFPFGVKGRMWNSIVSVPDHCLFIYFAGKEGYLSGLCFTVTRYQC